MKQEKTQKSKKWLWLILALVALLAAAGVVLALVLGGGEAPDPAGESGGRPQLYWNVEREQYIEQETGMSLRTKGEDGMYHILFAHDGQQVDLVAADKQIVNFIESMDVMGLAFDADGVIVDAVDPETIATKFADRFYISKITDTAITLNSSYAMNGMEQEIAITDMLGIYDVDPDAEVIGGSAEAGLMDEVLVYANDLNEPTHVYILTRAPESKVYWRLERMYDTENGVTTREPDENGVYTIQFACEGEHVELKCKDKALVNKIDSTAPLIGAFAFEFDEEGYIIDTVNVALSLRGKLLAQDYHVMEINGDQITIERISSGSDQGKRITFTLSEECAIYQCCRYGCQEGHCGEPTDHLKLYDRVNVYSDLEGNPVLIFVTIRQIDSPMYYNLERKYTSADGGHTTREKENGYYVFEMLADGTQVTLRTKDQKIADAIDYPYDCCVGLDVEGDIITRVYEAECVAGYYSPGYRRYVTSLTGGIFTITHPDDSSNFANCIMAENCKIYDVTGNPGVKKGTETKLQLNDRVIAWYDYAQKVNYIYVTDREVTTRAYCEYCKKTVTWEVANKNGLATQDSGKHLHLVVGEDVDVEWGYAILNKGTTICLNLYGSTIEHTSRIFVTGGSKLNIMGSGGIISNATHKNESLKTGNITVSNGEVNIYGGTIRSTSSKMPSININGKEAVVNLYGGTVVGGVDINIGTLNLGGKAKVLGAKGELKDNIYVGTTGKLNVKADWTGEASVKVAIISETGISKTFGTSEGAYTGKLYYESKGNPAVIGKDGGLVVVGEIIPDENDPDYRYCQHCGKRVMWSPAPVSGHGTLNSGEHIHYYLTEDFTRDWGYVVLQDKTTVCLDLNGFTINQMGRIFVGGAELNIMGEGTVTTREHKNATLNTGAITVNNGTVNIYGGTYTSDNPNAPAISLGSNAATVKLFGGKVIGGIRANAGKVTLGGNVNVAGTKGKNIYISNDANLIVQGDWTGTAGVAFSYVATNPVENGSCTGNYTGKLTLEEDNGYQIVPQDGKLYIPGYTIKAEVPIAPNFPEGVTNGVTSEAWCEACQRNVTWTSASSGLGTRADGGHYHLFTSLSMASDKALTWGLGTVNNGTTVCLYLNDTETVHNGRLFVLAGSTVNIMGKGILTTNGTSTSAGGLTGGITVNEGVVNVLGDIQIKSTNADVPAASVMHGKAALNLTSGSVVAGGALVNNGTLTLKGKVTADFIGVADMGKLAVDESFNGTAQLVFQSITENPVSNGSCTGNYTGKLTTNIEGTDYDVIAKEGKLYISGFEGVLLPEPIEPNFPKDVVNGETSEAWCEVCQKNVTWTSASSGLGTRADGGHYHLFTSLSMASDKALTWGLGTVNNGTTVCLYLNDTETVHNGRLFVAGGSTVNIMGKGILTTNGTSTSAGGLTGGITVNQGAVNVLGDVQIKSTKADVPAVAIQFANAAVNLMGGSNVTGGADVNNGKLSLAGNATADTITVAEAAKLEVAESFTGTAKVTFASITENPVANGISTGAFTGKLTTTIDGTDYDIVAEAGKLLISGYTVTGGTEPPAPPVDPEDPADDGLLHLDPDGKAMCEHCGVSVQWTAMTTAQGDKPNSAGTYHYYLTKDIDSGWATIGATVDAKVCLHLNGHTLSNGRRIRTYNGGVLSIMGAGTITGDNENPGTNTQATIEVGWKSTVNVYGGNFGSTANGVPTFVLNSTSATLNLNSGAVTDGITVTSGTLNLGGDTTVDSINVAAAGKLEVKADWTGTAKVTFASELVDGVVPAANGVSEGDFTGTLTTADGKKLIAKDGGLVIDDTGSDDEPVDDGKLKLDADNKGYCEACGENVVWTAAATGGLSTKNDGTHYHLYLSETYNKTWGYLTIIDGTKMCLHLNGFNIEQKGRIFVSGDDTVLNIMGKGTVASVTAHSNAELNSGSITVNSGTVNLYGGSYDSTVEGIPAVALTTVKATLNILGGNVTGELKVDNGTLTIGNDTVAANIQVAATGKLNVKADWTGTAKVTFASELVDGVVPAANGAAEGEFTGTLTTADGKKLIAKDGGLALEGAGSDDEDETEHPEVLKGQKIAAAANAMTFPTELKNGLTHEAYCPVCKADKTWTSYNTGFSTYFSDGGHYHVWVPTTNTITWGLGTVSNGTTVCVHLNGAELTHNSSLVVKGGSVVNIMGTGAVISNGTNATAANVTGNITVVDATVNLYGGTYISTASNGAPAIMLQNAAAVVNLYSGATVGGETDGVCTNVKITNGELNMYGGTIRNGVTAAHGGNVLVGSGTSTTTKAVFNMYEGTVTGGKAYTQTYAKGGNVFVFGTNGKTDTTVFNMYGGTLEKGAAVYGGNVAVQYATAAISGKLVDGAGTPSAGYLNPWGGNMYICNDSAVTFDGTITGGTGVYSGSVCVAASATLTMNGGSITGGVGAKNGGNVRVEGTFIMNDGEISGGNVTDETNGSHNLYLNNGTAILNGGTIYATDGTSLSGTGLFLNGTATAYLGGNTSIVRKDGVKQGCIVVGETAKLNVLNSWTGNASVKWPGTYAYGATVSNANGQCGSLTGSTFTAGGSYTGILLNELGDAAKILGTEGALILEAAPVAE